MARPDRCYLCSLPSLPPGVRPISCQTRLAGALNLLGRGRARQGPVDLDRPRPGLDQTGWVHVVQALDEAWTCPSLACGAGARDSGQLWPWPPTVLVEGGPPEAPARGRDAGPSSQGG